MKSNSFIKSIFSSILIKSSTFILAAVLLIILLLFVIDVTQNKISKISQDFSSGTVLNEFNSYVTTLEGSNKLQIATIKSIDKFTKKDSRSILWNLISLPDVIVEVQVPVEYVFFIDLKKNGIFNLIEKIHLLLLMHPQLSMEALPLMFQKWK